MTLKHQYRIIVLSFVLAAVKVLGADAPILGIDRSGARELSDLEAPARLGLSLDQVKLLTAGKEKLGEQAFREFQTQFGRLPDGTPTFQVAKGEYFVLIPLQDMERQPPAGAAGNPVHAQIQPAAALVQVAATVPADLPNRVDHSNNQSPVLNQGERGTCVAFAACANLEAQMILLKVDKPRLSENLAYFWFMREENSTPCQDPGLSTFRAAQYLTKHAVCPDAQWPYVGTNPVTLAAQKKCDSIDNPPGAVFGSDGWRIAASQVLGAGDPAKAASVGVKNTKFLEKTLAAGYDIVIGTVVAWKSADAKEVIDVTLGPAGQPIFGAGGHAMLVVGYDRSGPKPYFILKNSWGQGYGHGGYLYMSYNYMSVYSKYGYYTTKICPDKVARP